MKSIYLLLALTSFLTWSCDTKMKELGTNSTTNKKYGATTDTLSSFTISYATKYISTNNYALIQGTSGSGAAFTNTCTGAGTSCYCDFYDSSDTLLGSSGGGTASILYSSAGNFITCSIPAALVYANVAKVRLRDSSGSTYTSKATITTTLGSSGISLAKLLGGLDTNYARTIYSYQCYYYARQKTNTTTSSFDCTDQGVNDFNMLQATLNYYVYADAITSITGLRSTDYTFNNGNQFCGVMAKQIDCTSISSALTKSFGLYAQNTGAFTQQVQAMTGPPLVNPGFQTGVIATEGYAVPTSAFLDGHCPTGYVERSLYKVTAANLATAMGGDNELQDVSDYQILASSTSNANCATVNAPCIRIKQSTGGDCNGTACSLPGGAYAEYTSGSWPTNSTATSTFCVIDSTLLQ